MRNYNKIIVAVTHHEVSGFCALGVRHKVHVTHKVEVVVRQSQGRDEAIVKEVKALRVSVIGLDKVGS